MRRWSHVFFRVASAAAAGGGTDVVSSQHEDTGDVAQETGNDQ